MHVETIPKLILIDGISGSGKTTTCRWLEQQFRQRMIPAQAIYEEATPHPLHWWNYWDGTRHYPPDFDHVSPKTYMDISLGKWRQFIAHVSASNDIFVVEGVLYCLAVWFFLQGDTDRLDIAAYIKQVEAIITPAEPLLVYLRQDNIATHTRNVWSSRGAAMERELIGHIERTRYFRRRQLRGFDGLIRLWQETQALTDTLFSHHHIHKLTLEVTQADWGRSYELIRGAVFEAAQLDYGVHGPGVAAN